MQCPFCAEDIDAASTRCPHCNSALECGSSSSGELPQVISFDCPGCGHTLEAPEEMAGKKVKCPSCQASIDIPHDNHNMGPSAASPTQRLPSRRRALVAFTCLLVGLATMSIVGGLLRTQQRATTARNTQPSDQQRQQKGALDDSEAAAAMGLLLMLQQAGQQAHQSQEQQSAPSYMDKYLQQSRPPQNAYPDAPAARAQSPDVAEQRSMLGLEIQALEGELSVLSAQLNSLGRDQLYGDTASTLRNQIMAKQSMLSLKKDRLNRLPR